MINLKFDFKDFERMARQVGAFSDQVPFATALSLNDAVKETREYLITKTWPESGIKARNRSFIRASLTSRGQRASKRNLRVTIYDKLDRGNLLMHADGGTHRAKGSLAIPGRNIGRKASGAVKIKPAVLPNSFKLNGFIYQRYQVGKKHRRRVMYSLRSSAPIHRDVPFREDFDKQMRVEVEKAFNTRIQQAMKTRVAKS